MLGYDSDKIIQCQWLLLGCDMSFGSRGLSDVGAMFITKLITDQFTSFVKTTTMPSNAYGVY
jgi:hypothetical protein